MRTVFLLLTMLASAPFAFSQKLFKAPEKDTIVTGVSDTLLFITLPEIPVVTFKDKNEQMEFNKTLSRVRKVMPYVKIAKQLYANLLMHKEDGKKRIYRQYRKDLEKEMRDNFEKELKNLSVYQGMVLVKLINRETGDNCYDIIKEIKGGFSAFGWQIVAKHYHYDLKEKYDPQKERMIELAIKSLGSKYDVSTPHDSKYFSRR